MAVSFIGGGNHQLVASHCQTLSHNIKYTSSWVGFKHTTLVVKDTDCTGREMALYTGREMALIYKGREMALIYTGREMALIYTGREMALIYTGREMTLIYMF